MRQNTHLLEYLISIDESNRFKTKIDYTGKKTSWYRTPVPSMSSNIYLSDEFCNFIISRVYYNGSGFEDYVSGNNDQYKREMKSNNGDKSKCPQRLKSPFAIALQNRNLAMIKALIKEYGGLCAKVLTGNDWKLLLFNGKLQKVPGILTWLVEYGNIDHVLVENDVFGIIPEMKDEDTHMYIQRRFAKGQLPVSLLGVTVDAGTGKDFKLVLKRILEMYNVSTWDQFEKIGCMTDESFNKWIKWRESLKDMAFASFLMSLKQKAWDEKNIGILRLMVNDETQTNEEVINLTQILKNDLHCAKYLFKKCKKETLEDLANVINNGLLNYECGFNDSLLLLSKMINKNEFSKCLQTVTDECLSNDKKTTLKRCFFKNNLLASNIWAMQDNETTNNNKHNNMSEMKEKEIELKNKVKARLLLFDKINASVISRELEAQQMFIQNATISEEKTNEKLWKQLKQYVIKPDTDKNKNKNNSTVTLQKAIKSEYKVEELPYTGSNTNGFDAAKEYDHNVHLTRLLITSYRIDPIFQRDCKKLFTEYFFKKLGIKCKYSSAPVKTKARSITKCELDYKHHAWPHSQYILDFLRCSVQFDTIEDLLKACDAFNDIFDKKIGKVKDDLGLNICILGICRIKNGFVNISDESWKSALNEFTYYDIKFNVAIDMQAVDTKNSQNRSARMDNNSSSLIGEIQFIVKFMLDAKKMGHSIYSFVRKKDLFDKICNKLENESNNKQEIEKNIKQMIISQNLTQFSLFFQIFSENEKDFVLNNKEMILNFLKENKWNKGTKLFGQLKLFANS